MTDRTLPRRFSLPSTLALALLIGLLPAAGSLPAQTEEPVVPENAVTAETVRGLVPYASFDGSFENVNLYSGSLQVQLPLFTLPGRAGHDLGFSAVYTGGRVAFHERTHLLNGGGDPVEITLCNRRPEDIAGPWELGLGPSLGGSLAPALRYEAGQFNRKTNEGSVPVRRNQYVLTSLDGSEILFREINGKVEYIQSEWQAAERFRSTGGTYLSLQERDEDGDGDHDVVVLTPTGDRMLFRNEGLPGGLPLLQARSLTDANGNRIDYLYGSEVPLTSADSLYVQQATAQGDTVSRLALRDTLGRTVKLFAQHRLMARCATGEFPCASPGAQLFFFPVEMLLQVRNSAGSWLEYRLTQSGFDNSDGLFHTELLLPSGLSYSFDWQTFGPFSWTCGSGSHFFRDIRLTRVRYPNGGATRYDWRFQDGTTVVTARHLCPETDGQCGSVTQETTTYERGTLFADSDTRVTLPDGTQRRHHFQRFPTAEVGQLPLETTVETLTATGELLHTRTQAWSIERFNPRRVEEREVRHRTGEVRKTTFTYDASGYVTQGTVETAGNVTLRRDFDWGVGGPGPLLRQTRTRYLLENDPAYGVLSDVHHLRLPATVEILDGAGQVVSKTDWTYDQYGAGEPRTRSGAVQHSPPATGLRGNLTGIARRVLRAWNGGTSSLVQSTADETFERRKYDVLGNVIEVVESHDDGDRSTTHDYLDHWIGTACAPDSGSTFALPTATVNPLGHRVDRLYHSCGSQLAQTRDANGNATHFLYDSLDRLTETQLPDGGRRNWYYSDADGTATHRGVAVFDSSLALPVRIASITRIDDTLDGETLRVLDGLGRLSIEGRKNGSRYDWTKIEYDSRGRLFRSSQPITAVKATHADTPSATVFGNWTTRTYDALDRVLQVTAPDGSVSARLYDGSETVTTDPAGVQRATRQDALGRLVEVTEFLDAGSLDPRTGGPGGDPDADLSVTVTAPATVRPGQSFTYQLTVLNVGPSSTDQLWLTASLPAGVTLVSITGPSGWDFCDVTGTQVTCPGNTELASGSSRALNLNVTADAPGGDLTLVAQVRSDVTTDPAPANNTLQTVSAVQVATADLSLDKTAGATAVAPGELLSYSLLVVNAGPDSATDLVLSDPLPAGVAYVGASGFGWTCAEDAGLVVCTRDSLAPQTAGPVTLTVSVIGGGTITNTATVVASTLDPQLADNTSSPAVISVLGDADVELTQSASASRVVGRKDVTLTLSLTNHGPAVARGVRITDTLPPEVTFVAASGTGFTCAHASGVVTCDADGDLGVGAHTVSLEIRTPVTPTWLENDASVTTTSPDPVPGNDNPPPLELEVYTLIPVGSGDPLTLIPVHPPRPESP